MKKISIRSGKGLGDNLYLQSIARHYVENGYRPEVCTLWPDLFRPLAGKVDISPFRRSNVDKSAHYIDRKSLKTTDQFTDCCLNCGIKDKVDLRLDWEIVNQGWVERFRGERRPIVLVQMPRDPMGRADGYGLELLPDPEAYRSIVRSLKGRAFAIQIGAGTPRYDLGDVDLNLGNKTSVTDLLDIASIADGAVGYCSFIVPLAESLHKPALLLWSSRGLRSANMFIKQIVPEKILNKPSSRSVLDSSDERTLIASVDTFLEQIGNRATV